ncbi:MAG: PqqD family protein [Clostridia bacterium]|nr:PqqD family protein [Clostridia bacterium]
MTQQVKIKSGFILREVAGETVVIPSGDTMDLNMMITLNPTGRFLWEQMQTKVEPATLVDRLCQEYDVDAERAQKSVELFLKQLNDNGLLEEL